MAPERGPQLLEPSQRQHHLPAPPLEDLVRQFPGLQGRVVTEDGALHKFVNVYVNDDDVRYLDKLDTKLSDDDVVSILPAVAGGFG